MIRFLYEHQMLGGYARAIDTLNRYFKISFTEGTHPIGEFYRRTDIFVFQAVTSILILTGLGFILQKKSRIILLLWNITLLFALLGVAEIYFSTESAQKKYGSVQWEEKDEAFNRERQAEENSLGFRDAEHARKKSEGVFRIGCLGDSFVWGDGVAPRDRWGHILDKKLKTLYGDNVEVLHWGKRGWSTEDELNFLKKEGKEFEIDLMIIAFVVNDPHVRGVSMPRCFFIWDNIVRKFPFFKNTLRFITIRVNELLTATPYFTCWEYFGWDKSLYTEENLKAYEGILTDLDRHLEERGISYFFVTMPMPTYSLFWRYEKVFVIFRRLGIAYLDLTPVVMEKFGHLTIPEIRGKLWANPVNSHPSRMLAELYADTIFIYLEQNWADRLAYKENSATRDAQGISNAA